MDVVDQNNQDLTTRRPVLGAVLIITVAVALFAIGLCVGVIVGMNVLPISWLNWPIQQGFVVALCVNFQVQPWVKTEDYGGVKSAVTEKIKLAFDENGISIPYPQMDVHLNGKE